MEHLEKSWTFKSHFQAWKSHGKNLNHKSLGKVIELCYNHMFIYAAFEIINMFFNEIYKPAYALDTQHFLHFSCLYRDFSFVMEKSWKSPGNPLVKMCKNPGHTFDVVVLIQCKTSSCDGNNSPCRFEGRRLPEPLHRGGRVSHDAGLLRPTEEHFLFPRGGFPRACVQNSAPQTCGWQQICLVQPYRCS